jgi:hypothetical protein
LSSSSLCSYYEYMYLISLLETNEGAEAFF